VSVDSPENEGRVGIALVTGLGEGCTTQSRVEGNLWDRTVVLLIPLVVAVPVGRSCISSMSSM
jgi:hypothetical protein